MGKGGYIWYIQTVKTVTILSEKEQYCSIMFRHKAHQSETWNKSEHLQ